MAERTYSQSDVDALIAAAYRKAAELCKNTLLHTLDPGNRIRDGILALISLSAQSALDEMISAAQKEIVELKAQTAVARDSGEAK